MNLKILKLSGTVILGAIVATVIYLPANASVNHVEEMLVGLKNPLSRVLYLALKGKANGDSKDTIVQAINNAHPGLNATSLGNVVTIIKGKAKNDVKKALNDIVDHGVSQAKNMNKDTIPEYGTIALSAIFNGMSKKEINAIFNLVS